MTDKQHTASPPSHTQPSTTSSSSSDGRTNPPHAAIGKDFSAAWAVDAACSGNPGPMEYQGIDLQTGECIFHFGPVYGTNNIGEFLAIVHALALMEQKGVHKTIYSDSYTAITWVKKKHCKTQLERNEQTRELYEVIARAENWLRTHAIQTPILQWDTRKYGDIPADFGRK